MNIYYHHMVNEDEKISSKQYLRLSDNHSVNVPLEIVVRENDSISRVSLQRKDLEQLIGDLQFYLNLYK